MDVIVPLFTGFVLGCLHAFDADHLSAVTVFASKHPRPSRAVQFGFLWGLGHTTALMVLGLIVMMFKFALPPVVESLAELSVGLLLMMVGAWALADTARSRKLHIHRHTHEGVEHIHIHSHTHGADHHHRHSLFAIGATHGLAGTASVLVIIPLAISQSLVSSLLFLVLFGVGTIVAMSSFALFFGVITARLVRTVKPWQLQFVAAVGSIVIGFIWIGQVLFA
jgi:sulfite exporter TauE/SafE